MMQFDLVVVILPAPLETVGCCAPWCWSSISTVVYFILFISPFIEVSPGHCKCFFFRPQLTAISICTSAIIRNEGATSLSLFFCTIVPLFCGWCTKSTFFIFPDRFTWPRALFFAVLLVPRARALDSFCRIRWMDGLKPKILTEDNSSEPPGVQLFTGVRSFQPNGLCSCIWCDPVGLYAS